MEPHGPKCAEAPGPGLVLSCPLEETGLRRAAKASLLCEPPLHRGPQRRRWLACAFAAPLRCWGSRG